MSLLIAKHWKKSLFIKALYSIEGKGENSLWVRPKTMFEEELEIEGKRIKRFEFIN